jgi:acetate---CoA ligase (ADP-forming)
MTGRPGQAHGVGAVSKFLRPESIAIVGASARPGSAGANVLESLKLNDFGGDIHLIGRADEIDGRRVLKSPSDLPEGVDLAVFTLPSGAIRDAAMACVERQVGCAVIFATGYAESGQETAQQDIARIASEGGLALVGPNCAGFTNNVDGLAINWVMASKAHHLPEGSGPGVAFAGASGGLIGTLARAAEERRMPVTYTVSSGNEAGLDLADFVEFFTEDPLTNTVALYAEQLRRPKQFLDACRRARAAGTFIVMLHPGRSAKAKQAARSHTGALVGNYEMMRTLAEDAGVLLVDMIDELVDTCEILNRFPEPPRNGLAVLSGSGATTVIINDFADEIKLDLAELSPRTIRTLAEVLPEFDTYGNMNPLDFFRAGVTDKTVVDATTAILGDPNVGMLFNPFPGTFLEPCLEGISRSSKPAIVIWREPLDNPAVFTSSFDRMLRAIGHYMRYGQYAPHPVPVDSRKPSEGIPQLRSGLHPEWLSKQVLAAAGIRIPQGALARDVEEALTVAQQIGYPVAVKAQGVCLSHKSEVGAVILNVADEGSLHEAWRRVKERSCEASPDAALDGILVERMSPAGIELMVGAKRDPDWGSVLLIGLGGIWVEALEDVRLLPVAATEEEIIQSLHQLRSAALLSGIRGTPPADIAAAARTAAAIGHLMQTRPELIEIDINPLVVHAQGQGATAVDALIVSE